LQGYAPFRMDAIEWEDGEALESLREGGYSFSLKPYQILTICLSNGSRPMPGIVLASRSPRRKELLTRAGVVFEADPAQGAEASWDGVMTPGEYARCLSSQKAQEVSLKHPGKLTLGADTVVAVDDQIFGKPADLEEAKSMLRQLSGRSHLVITGTTLAKDGKALFSWQTNTRVRFRELSEEDIEKYLASIDPLDKAGAYAIQEHGDQIVAEIHGLFSNVVGLPVEQVLPLLRAARDGMLATQE
jgi:septum formation protein